MGCICEAHYSVRGNNVIRELRLYRGGVLASESVVVRPVELAEIAA